MLLITETWLNSNVPDDILYIPDYSLVRGDRQHKKGGGVCAFLQHDFFYKTVDIPDKPSLIDMLCLELKTTYCVLVYIPPARSSTETYVILDFLISLCDNMLKNQPDKELMIVGDFNKMNTQALESNHNLCNIVTQPTRLNNVLDLCFVHEVKKANYKCDVQQPIANSDHNTIYIQKKQTTTNTLSTKKQILVINKESMQNCNVMLDRVNWTSLYNEPDVNKKVEIFYSTLLAVVDQIPKKLVKNRPRDKPWITVNIKTLIDKRWKAFHQRNFYLYNILKERTRLEIEKQKRIWAGEEIKRKKNVWDLIKKEVQPQRNSISSLFKACNNPTVVLNQINEQFSSVFTESQDIEVNFEVKSIKSCNLFSCKEVEAQLLKIDLKKSILNDGIPSAVYKKCHSQLTKPLTNIFNTALMQATVPQTWKVHEIIPIPKTKPANLDKLRPISLSPLPLKLLEKLIMNRIKDIVIDKLSPNQFGFRPFSSTTSALIDILDQTTTFLEQQNIESVTLIAFDLSKAFDCVSHNLLVNKLLNFIPHEYVMFFIDYLSNRRQRVIYESHKSTLTRITSGVPQGSPLSPLLFNIYFDDFQLTGPAKVIKYADDTTIIIPNFKDEQSSVEAVKDKFNEWCTKNKLAVNMDKTQSITVNKKNHANKNESLKILGMWIESTLKWDKNIDEVIKKCSSRLYILRKMTPLLNKSQKAALFNGIVQSVIDYGCPAYGKLKVKHEKQLNRIIKRAHFIICQSNCNKNCLTLFSKRQQQLSLRLFRQIEQNSKHVLHNRIPPKLPRTKQYRQELSRTTRRQAQFFPYMTQFLNHSRL